MINALLIGDDERLPEEFHEYSPYSLSYEEAKSIEEIEHIIRGGCLDSQTVSDFKEYLQYLKAKLAHIVDLELREGNYPGELPESITKIQNLLYSIAKRPVC